MTTVLDAFRDFFAQPFGAFGAIAIGLAITVMNSRRLSRALTATGAPVTMMFNGVTVVGGLLLLTNAVIRDEIVWVFLELYITVMAIKGLHQDLQVRAGADAEGEHRTSPQEGTSAPASGRHGGHPNPLAPETRPVSGYQSIVMGSGTEVAYIGVPGIAPVPNSNPWLNGKYESLRRGFERRIETDRDVRVHLINQAIVGATPVVALDVTAAHLEAELQSVRSLGVKRVVVVGHSLGAIAMLAWLADRHESDDPTDVSWVAINPPPLADMLWRLMAATAGGDLSNDRDPIDALAGWWSEQADHPPSDIEVELTPTTRLALPVHVVASYLRSPFGLSGVDRDPMGALVRTLVRLESNGDALSSLLPATHGFPTNPGRVILSSNDAFTQPVLDRLDIGPATVAAALRLLGIPTVVVPSDHNLSNLNPGVIDDLGRSGTEVHPNPLELRTVKHEVSPALRSVMH